LAAACATGAEQANAAVTRLDATATTAVTASVPNVSFSSGAASGEMKTLVPSSTASVPSIASGFSVLPVFWGAVFGFGGFAPPRPPAVTLNRQAESGPVVAVVMEPGKRARVDLTV